jgi:hypothetical protein
LIQVMSISTFTKVTKAMLISLKLHAGQKFYYANSLHHCII